ncbi:MAG: Na+/H+ antiporter NhaA, partial [Bifidobacteriaceae bacterium]|nr:Na+/H+ antiporter NhaA [Bifidobacteriaceae bacterium]
RFKLENFVSSGYLLIAAAVLGLLLSNLPTHQAVDSFINTTFDYHFFRFTVDNIVEEGLLTIFFLNVGLYLKHEFIFGPFNNPKKAALPIIAATGGVIVPTVIFTIVALSTSNSEIMSGWAIPSVTDIALSLAVLSFAIGKIKSASSSHIKTFLMTLAVADDIFGIIIIALFYSKTLYLPNLFFSILLVAVWSIFSRFDPKAKWLILAPVAILSWLFMLESGVHTAIVGVLLGFTVNSSPKKGNWKSRIVKYEKISALVSGLIVLPVYIFFKMNINFAEIFGNLVSQSSSSHSNQMPVLMLAIVLGLLIGKPFGIITFSRVSNRFTPFKLDKSISSRSLSGIGALAGIGFTVSFLIADLSYASSVTVAAARLAIIIGSLISAAIGFAIFKR